MAYQHLEISTLSCQEPWALAGSGKDKAEEIDSSQDNTNCLLLSERGYLSLSITTPCLPNPKYRHFKKRGTKKDVKMHSSSYIKNLRKKE